ncbi:MAG: alanine racemase, partial [Candidatus Delongbacteria bacterium]|nr:alanine racemase [Candidatus Delongbacteria bacterium]
MEIHISRSAVENNLNLIKKIVGESVRISSVVKANAYGHGIESYVPVAREAGIDHFSVFSYNEAIQVYKITKKTADIMIMGWIGTSQLKDVVRKGIEFYVFN